MRPPPNQWPDDTPTEMVLFFAQSVQEMLNGSTYESFRAPTLEAVGRLHEAQSLIANVIADRLPHRTLDPVLEELVSSLNNDTTAKAIILEEIELLTDTIKANGDIDDIGNKIRYVFRHLIGSYKKRSEERMLNLLEIGKEKIQLRSILGNYCSFLVNEGYHPLHISNIAAKIFFDESEIKESKSLVETFFSQFDQERRRLMYTRESAAILVDLLNY
jgi:hypothetical protein